MKRLVIISGAVLAIVAVTAVCRADGSHEGFSNKSLHGVYVVKFQGTNSGGDGTLEGESLAPVNGVGLIKADGDGHFTGMQTANILFNTNGSPTAASPGPCPGPFGVCTAVCTTTLKGTYTVNPDGTGSITATAIPSGTDLRCGPKSGFTTSSDIILKSPGTSCLSAPTSTARSAAKPRDRKGRRSSTTEGTAAAKNFFPAHFLITGVPHANYQRERVAPDLNAGGKRGP